MAMENAKTFNMKGVKKMLQAHHISSSGTREDLNNRIQAMIEANLQMIEEFGLHEPKVRAAKRACTAAKSST